MIKNAVFYVGNIMQRTLNETSCNAFTMVVKSEISCFILKENAILYKTKNGGFVDVDNLSKKSDYKKVNKVAIKDRFEKTNNGIAIMPTVAISDAAKQTTSWGMDGTLGLFVDSESLSPCSSSAIKLTKKLLSKRHRFPGY